MLQDNFNHSTLTQQSDFDIKTFLDLLLSEYVAIQNLTLDILDILTRQTKGNRVPTDFQNVGGIALLLKILKVIIQIESFLVYLFKQYFIVGLLINFNVIYLVLLGNFLKLSTTIYVKYITSLSGYIIGAMLLPKNRSGRLFYSNIKYSSLPKM